MPGGFRDEDEDFADLLKQPTLASSSYAFGSPDEDLSANPFADLASSSTAALYTPPAFDTDSQQARYDPDDNSVAGTPRLFSRENAPEPETPAFMRTQSSTSAEAFRMPASNDDSPVHMASSPFQPAYSPSTQQSPFSQMSPPLFQNTSGQRDDYMQHERKSSASKADLSALLGEEKPILPRFARRGPESPSRKTSVLPVSSIGRRQLAGPLAALLGEDDGQDPKLTTTTQELSVEGSAQGSPQATPQATGSKAPGASTADAAPPVAQETPATVSAEVSDEVSPASGAVAKSPNSEAVTSASRAPSSIPLPPSVPSSPPRPSRALKPTEEGDSRASSRTPSTFSVSSSDVNTPYDALVSPMEKTVPTIQEDSVVHSEDDGDRQIDGLEEKLQALQVDESQPMPGTEGSGADQADTAVEASSLPASSTETSATVSADDPFAQYTVDRSGDRPDGSAKGFRSFNSSLDESAARLTDDTDSLRGTYSRSVDVSDGGEDSAQTSVTETERGQRSPPLPPVPNAESPSVSRASLPPQDDDEPAFVIEVGDPQKVGSSLNVAAQHTVYTVRTKTTSKAFRKSDFSVLRRYSHFVWLYDALTQNNPGVIVPGMPEKSAFGRFDSDFVENRRSGLQAALMKIVQHPMLVGDPDLRLFLESDTFSVDIKQRKIDTPSESKGLFASLGHAISGPTFVEFDDYFEQRKHTLDAFETSLRALLGSLSSAAKARHTLLGSIGDLQASLLALSNCDLSTSLKRALIEAAKLQDTIKKLGEEQMASEDQIGGFNSVVETYARLCASARLVFGARVKAYHTWQNAESHLRKVKSTHEKARRSGRPHDMLGLSVAEVNESGSLQIVFGNQAERKMIDAKQDFEDVSKLTKAEMTRFDQEKVDDFKKAIGNYVDGMAMRQRLVVEAWQAYHDLLVNAVAANTPSSPSSRVAVAPTTNDASQVPSAVPSDSAQAWAQG